MMLFKNFMCVGLYNSDFEKVNVNFNEMILIFKVVII